MFFDLIEDLIRYKELLCQNEPQKINDFINDNSEKLSHVMFSAESYLEKWTKYKKEPVNDISSNLNANNNHPGKILC